MSASLLLLWVSDITCIASSGADISVSNALYYREIGRLGANTIKEDSGGQLPQSANRGLTGYSHFI